MKTAEQQRLDENTAGSVDWQRWGPYLSDRSWGTVREDYSTLLDEATPPHEYEPGTWDPGQTGARVRPEGGWLDPLPA